MMEGAGLTRRRECVDIASMNPQNFTADDEANLREALKRCSPETVEKAVEFRKTGNPELVGDVVMGIIERFVEPDKRELLKSSADDLKVMKGLGLDSLTMVEVVLSVEDAIGTTIDNDEIQNLQTVGDIKKFIRGKVGA